MTLDTFPVGQEMDVIYPDFTVNLKIRSFTEMAFEIKEGLFAHKETVAIQVVPLGNSIFAVSWNEHSGATVVNIQDYDRGVVHSFVTLSGGKFLTMVGPIDVTKTSDRRADDRPIRNKKLVVEAMTALFQRHDASAVERLYARDYVQHNPTIAQGREALGELVSGLAADVDYEPGLMIAERDYVAIHGRIRGWAPTPQVVIDLFRIEDGKLAEHWDVLQDEMQIPGGGFAMFEADEHTRQTALAVRNGA